MITKNLNFREGFYYIPVAFLSKCQELLTQIYYHLDMTDVIFLPLTRAWGGEGYDEAVGGGRVVTRAGRARISEVWHASVASVEL